MFRKCLFKVTDVQCFGQFGFLGFSFLIQVFCLSKITDSIGRDFLSKHTGKIGRQEWKIPLLSRQAFKKIEFTEVRRTDAELAAKKV